MASYINPMVPMSLQAQPLTPDPSPTHKNESRGAGRGLATLQISNNVLLDSETGGPPPSTRTPHNSGHIPFILAYDSQILAQQLTLIEKAALSEIDWKDLVDMGWSNDSRSAPNWAEYLSARDRKGIDLVVARFNLMVKWVLSEIVLTRSVYERARTVTKYIHVAAHARRVRNYSTMLQIALALSSIDCTRLLKTWKLVAPAEKRLLKEMESLIQPIRNFHDLRVEMESANLQEGCIPFVGKCSLLGLT
jgi:hypothetical protein